MRATPRLVEELARVVREQVGELLPAGRPVALLDYPNHDNIGDAAIWLGERALLRQLEVPVGYVADQRGYRPEHLRRALPEGPILLHGGGNFGDLYPKHQRLRERVVADFPDRRVIQLPQTVTFDDEALIGSSARRFRAHPAFTLMVRDRRCLERFGGVFTDAVLLCPDSAFCLPPPADRSRNGILWLSRTDGEAVEPPEPLPERISGARRVDWARPSKPWRRRRMMSRGMSFATSLPGSGGLVRRGERLGLRWFDRLALERVDAGLRQLGSCEAVATDRLHGHVLALVCGTPAVLSDSRTGKVAAFHQTWTQGSELVRWATSAREAVSTAVRLVDRQAPPD